MRERSPGRRAASLAIARLAVSVTVLSAGVVLGGGTVVWALERDVPGATYRSWADAVWWALTTLTTVGYGDQVPITTPGRVVAAGVMVAGVAVVGAVAAVVALTFARALASEEEQALRDEAETLESRVQARLDLLDQRLAGIEQALRERRPTGT